MTQARALPRIIPALTGLRGFGALWVVLFHLQPFGGGAVARLGYLGVDLFFLLSGVVLTHTYWRDFAAVTGAGYRRFLLLRLVRVYPLHAVMLGLMGGAVVLAPEWFREQADAARVFSPEAFVANAFLVQNWAPRFSVTWNGPAWSVSVEWAAYVAFPFLVPIVLRVQSRRVAAGAAVLCIALFAGGSIACGQYDPHLIFRGALVRMALEFTAGCFLYRAFMLGARIDDRAGAVAVAGGVACLLLAPRSAFVALPLFLVVLLLGMQGRSVVVRVFESRAALFLGEVSYSIYLMHWFLLILATHVVRTVAPELSHGDAWKAVFLVVLIPVSYLGFRFVELPSRRLGRRLASRMGQFAPMDVSSIAQPPR